MSMFKNLKSLFVTEDIEEKAEPKDNKTEKAAESTSSSSVAKPVTPISSNRSSAGAVDSKILDRLLKIIEDNNLDGFDYLEYKKSLKALEKMPMDEATKYRSAFATASTMGVTLDKLVQSTKHYLGVLKSENSHFTNASKAEVKKRVSDKESQLGQFDNLIKEKSEKIKALTEEIAKHQKQIEELKSEIETGHSKIAKTQLDFEKSYLYLKNQLEEDVVKMEKYLK